MPTARYIVGFLVAGLAMGQRPPSLSAPVVLELFTSEGCSSCVPADILFNQIENGALHSTEVITLGEHVDYWDSAEWRDRFSSPLFSSRQQDYGRAFRAQDVFTPQVVIQGETQCIGSDLSCIQRAVESAARQPHAIVGIRTGNGDVIGVSVQQLPFGAHAADVLLGITQGGLS